MKRELIARLILFILLVAAGFVGVIALAPTFGYTTPWTPSADYELHANMPENGGWSEETLHAVAGQPIHLRLTSDDVMHSFAIGQSDKAPIDLEPGKWAETTLVFDQPGRYIFYCTRWCGRNHWRMRGTILVEPAANSSPAAAASSAEKPLYLRLGLKVDAPHPAKAIPAAPPSAERGAALLARLPADALERQTYLTTAPADLWQRLRDELSLADLSDADLWDTVAAIQAKQVTPQQLAEAKQLFATNCAACHGETGKGDGVMVEGLPRFDPAKIHLNEAVSGDDMNGMAGMSGDSNIQGDMNLSAPPDFTDPHGLLGASPALLQGKMLRGGMGTGMPYWGPIFTEAQMDGLIAYLYGFAMQRK